MRLLPHIRIFRARHETFLTNTRPAKPPSSWLPNHARHTSCSWLRTESYTRGIRVVRRRCDVASSLPGVALPTRPRQPPVDRHANSECDHGFVPLDQRRTSKSSSGTPANRPGDLSLHEMCSLFTSMTLTWLSLKLQMPAAFVHAQNTMIFEAMLPTPPSSCTTLSDEWQPNRN